MAVRCMAFSEDSDVMTCEVVCCEIAAGFVELAFSMVVPGWAAWNNLDAIQAPVVELGAMVSETLVAVDSLISAALEQELMHLEP